LFGEFAEAPPHLIIWMVKLRVLLKSDVEVPLNGCHLHPSFVLDIWTPKTKLCMDVNAYIHGLSSFDIHGLRTHLFDANALEEIKLFSYFVISLFTCPTGEW
jgi:hypothetical protein